MQNLDRYLNFAKTTAFEAGRLTSVILGCSIEVDFKKMIPSVTIADRQAEELIRSRIEHAFPDHGFLGEEFGGIEGQGLPLDR
ncbi:MAG: hypothetical protein R2865_09205 [Deinococcales bacterium]